jgi:DNA invertase Pin-like site-specific DNA recombinase
MEHRESRERQYALVNAAEALGWPAERVLVIDEDQGQSGKSADNRNGFQRVLAEVTMDHVGIVLGLDRVKATARDHMPVAQGRRRCIFCGSREFITRPRSGSLPRS